MSMISEKVFEIWKNSGFLPESLSISEKKYLAGILDDICLYVKKSSHTLTNDVVLLSALSIASAIKIFVNTKNGFEINNLVSNIDNLVTNDLIDNSNLAKGLLKGVNNNDDSDDQNNIESVNSLLEELGLCTEDEESESITHHDVNDGDDNICDEFIVKFYDKELYKLYFEDDVMANKLNSFTEAYILSILN